MNKAEKLEMVYSARVKEHKTFREIGDRLGVGSQRAHRLFFEAKWMLIDFPREWYYPLSVRAVNVLLNMNIQSRAECLEAIKSGRLQDTKPGMPWLRNYGTKTHKEVCNWLGITD